MRNRGSMACPTRFLESPIIERCRLQTRRVVRSFSLPSGSLPADSRCAARILRVARCSDGAGSREVTGSAPPSSPGPSDGPASERDSADSSPERQLFFRSAQHDLFRTDVSPQEELSPNAELLGRGSRAVTGTTDDSRDVSCSAAAARPSAPERQLLFLSEQHDPFRLGLTASGRLLPDCCCFSDFFDFFDSVALARCSADKTCEARRASGSGSLIVCACVRYLTKFAY